MENLAPLIEDDIDFVIGSRVEKFREKGAMKPQQIFGNWLATFLMRVFFNSKFIVIFLFHSMMPLNLYLIFLFPQLFL